MSNPVKLSTIGSGGRPPTNPSVASTTCSTTTRAPGKHLTIAPTVFTTLQRFQQFETSMNGGSGDEGNLTNIDAFTSPLSIKS